MNEQPKTNAARAITDKAMIIDYGSGNLRSAEKALQLAASRMAKPLEVVVSADPDLLAIADHVILPGVGAFADCDAGLSDVPGLKEALIERIIHKARPFLGICVGMQLMAEEGHEHKITPGFGWIKGKVVKMIPPESQPLPHMGWNTLSQKHVHPALNGLNLGPQGLHAYFVHSYHMVCDEEDNQLVTSDYGSTFTAITGRDNMIGTQFHPEKSQTLGLQFLQNFLEWRP